jgi:lysozyme
MPINVIVDLSHHNGAVDLAQAEKAGIIGVILKATQGTGFVDPIYQENRIKAEAAGLLCGAYHYAVGADGVEQADHFLTVVQPGAQDLLVLDLEANAQGPSMTLNEARAFVTHIGTILGRPPGLYAGHYVKELLGTNSDPVLRTCWFWLSQYGPTPVVPPNWNTWTMWQYTDGALGPEPHQVPGIGRCDRDQFNGDLDALKTLWGVAANKASSSAIAAATAPELAPAHAGE